MTGERRAFEDLRVGDRFETPARAVGEAEIVAFARQYDPKPHHTDLASPETRELGGLIASGLQTLALSFGLFFRLPALEGQLLASPGFDQVRFPAPLRPGDTIRHVAEVTRLEPSRSRADRGRAWIRHETLNQRGEVILTLTCVHVVRRRDPA